MRLLLLLLFTSVTHSFAQVTIPFRFTSEDDNRLIKENDSVKYFAATGDTSCIVSLNEEALWYRLLNSERKVIAEGAYVMEGEKFLQDGKWKAYNNSGRLKISGYYQRSIPVGTWYEYYSGGKIKTVYNYAIINQEGIISSCLSGTYQEYYSSGKLKVNGFYSATFKQVKDTVTVWDPVAHEDVIKESFHPAIVAEKSGHWEYYTEEGDLEKKDE